MGSADEVATGYGHLAKTIELPEDRMWVAFEIRPEARFADGTPVTAEDVAWTFDTLMEKGRPSIRVTYGDVADVVAESPTPGRVPLQVQPEPGAAAAGRRDARAAEALVGEPGLQPSR